jgi:hypothetical protein
MFVSGKPFHLRLIFVGKARVEHLKGALHRWAPALLASIRQGWKGLPGTNALAHYENL